jgi:hypothetical protein
LPWIKPTAYNAATDFLNRLDDDGLAGYIVGLKEDITKFDSHTDYQGITHTRATQDIPTPGIGVEAGVMVCLPEMILRTRSQLPKAKVEARLQRMQAMLDREKPRG